MIIQMGTEVDESRILWKHKESDEWKRADIDDLIRAYENRPAERTREWTIQNCPKCGKFTLKDWIVCPYCGADMRGDNNE